MSQMWLQVDCGALMVRFDERKEAESTLAFSGISFVFITRAQSHASLPCEMKLCYFRDNSQMK